VAINSFSGALLLVVWRSRLFPLPVTPANRRVPTAKTASSFVPGWFECGHLSRFHAAKGSRVGREFKGLNGLQIVHIAHGRKVEDLVQEYEDSGLVEYAEPDFQMQATVLANDPAICQRRVVGLDNTGASGLAHADIGAPAAWDTQNSAANVIVAVIDSGIRYTHEDLAANLWTNPGDGSHGYNALNNSNNPWDDNGHGTLVAGIIGAAGNNGKGVSGVAWRVQSWPANS